MWTTGALWAERLSQMTWAARPGSVRQPISSRKSRKSTALAARSNGAWPGSPLAFGAELEFGYQELTFEAQELLGGSLSVIVVGLVTWMVFWTRRTARHLKSDLHWKLDAALRMGAGALVATALLAVGHEGLETALFVWASLRGSGEGTSAPLVGVLLGIATAILLGYLFYRGALKINLATFFTWTGGMLVIVVAGVLAYGVHDLQEARFLGGLADKAFDVSATLPPDSWYGTLLKGVFDFQPDPTALQIVVWSLYLLVTMCFFLAPQRASAWKAPSTGPASVGERSTPSRVTPGDEPMADGKS